MPITVTEDWRKDQKSLAAPWTATKVYIVTGTTDADSALTATGVPQVDSLLMAGSPLKCAGPRIQEHAGLDYWVIACDYAIPDKGTFDTQKTDPLDNPVLYQWEQVDIDELVDRDLDGKAMTNSAGFAYEPVSRTMSFDRLTIYRNEPWFDVAKAVAFRNGVNSAATTIGGVPVAAEHCRCAAIIPAEAYSPDPPFIRMRYVFDIMFDSVSWGLYPWQHRRLDEGNEGWYQPSGGTYKMGRFTTENGNSLARPTRLNGSGVPIDTAVRVWDGYKGWDAYLSSSAKTTTPYQTDNQVTAGGGYWRIYKKCRPVDFSSLGL